MWTTFWVGGKIAASQQGTLHKLLRWIGADNIQGVTDDGDNLTPNGGECLMVAGDFRYATIETFEGVVRSMNLSYRIHIDPDDEGLGAISQWSPGMKEPETIKADDHGPVISMGALEALIAEGHDVQSILAVMKRFDVPIPPIEIVPNPAPGPMETAGAH